MQTNIIYNEDCLTLLQGIPNNTINLIYIDPPFNCKRDQEFGMPPWKDNNQKPNRIDEILPIIPDDTGTRNYLRFMYLRIKEMHRVLRDDGSIYVHCDWRVNSYLRLVLDEIFGANNFRNEISTTRIRKNVQEYEKARRLNVALDSVLLYSKSDLFKITIPRKDVVLEDRWHAFDAPNVRNGMDYELFGVKPPHSRHWMWSKERAEKAIIDGLLRKNPKTGKPEYKVLSKQPTVGTLWNDISAYSFNNSYATEKSEVLLDRIIQASSYEGDLVADFFCGSGTTLAVAEKLGRKWIGCDSNKVAVDISTERINKIDKGLL